MDQLAAQEIDPFDEPVEDQGPVPFEIPGAGVELHLFGFLCPRPAGLFPEESAEVFVLEDRHDQRLMLEEDRCDVPLGVEFSDAVEERPQAVTVANRFPLVLVPSAVEGVEGDPLADQRDVEIGLAVELLDALKPATGPVEADVCGMFGVELSKPLLVRFPASAQVSDSGSSFGHDGNLHQQAYRCRPGPATMPC